MTGPQPEGGDSVDRGDERGQVPPWWIVGVLGLAVVGGAAGLPAPYTAAVLLALFIVATARHPGNGLAALILTSAFFLGEHRTPYFLLQHAAVLVVLLSFLVHRWGGRFEGTRGYGVAALAFIGAAVVAVPLNLRDLLEDLWLLRSFNWSQLLVQGIPDISNLKYLERVAIVGLAVGVFVVAARPSMVPAVIQALAALPAVVALVAAFGLVRFFGVLHTSGQYLTLSFATWQHPDLRLTAIAWNPDYLAQFLALVLPLVVVAGWARGPAWQRGLAILGAGLGALALLLTFQRAAYGALALALLALVWLARPAGRPLAARRQWSLVAVMLGVVLVGVALDHWWLHGRLAARVGHFLEDPNRLTLWTIALRMAADHPILGVGTGRYAHFFHEYVPPAFLKQFGPFWGTAHSTYLELAAEQGLVGLLSFAALFGSVWLGGVRRLPRLPSERRDWLAGLLAALVGWFAYAVVQYVFRVDALAYLVCILAGTVVALAPPDRPLPRRRPLVLAGLALMGLLLAWRVPAALERPVSPGYELGFYRWERQVDGRPARWTEGRAAMSVPVEGRVIELAFRAPIPGVEGRPQAVRVWVDDRPAATVRLATGDWRTLTVPVNRPRGSHVLVELEAAYTFVPHQLTGSSDVRRLGVMVGPVAWRDA